MAIQQVRSKDLIPILQTCFLAKEPILIAGAGGIGKSDIVSQCAESMGMDIMIDHPVVSDPTDDKGFPFAFNDDEGGVIADFIPYGSLRKAMGAEKPTAWFYDDLGQAAPMVQAAKMQLLLAREINGMRISDHITFVACTNRRKDKAGVKGILGPIKSRFAAIVELTPHIDDLRDWSMGVNTKPQKLARVEGFDAWIKTKKIKSSVLSYLQFDTGALIKEPTNDIEPIVCPRVWAKLSKLLYASEYVPMTSQQRAKLIRASVGAEIGEKYLAFERINADLPDIDGIISNPMTFIGSSKRDQMFAVVNSVAQRCTLENFRNITILAGRMPIEFSKLLIDTCRKVEPGVVNTPAFADWSYNNFDIVKG